MVSLQDDASVRAAAFGQGCDDFLLHAGDAVRAGGARARRLEMHRLLLAAKSRSRRGCTSSR